MVLIKNKGEKIFQLAWETQNYQLNPGEMKLFSPAVARAILKRCPDAEQVEGEPVIIPSPEPSRIYDEESVEIADLEPVVEEPVIDSAPQSPEPEVLPPLEPAKDKKPVSRQDMRRLRSKSK